jgi:iron(III) transport system substrate-binding protein
VLGPLYTFRSPTSSVEVVRRRLSLAFLALVALAGVLAGCSSDGDRLTVYSGRNEELLGPLLEQFAEETGISIDVRYDQSANLALLIDEEGEQSPADVFISQSPGAEGYLDELGVLAPLPDSVLALVPESSRAADGSWVGLSARYRTLVYDSDQVSEDELPESVLDLVDPRYEGEVAVAPENGSFQDFVTSMRTELGDDETQAWLEGMAENDSPVYADNLSIVDAVARGVVRYGLVNHYYNFRILEEDPDAASRNHFFSADDLGSLRLVTGASILESSDQPDEAAELIEFLLAEDAQRFFTDETFEYPLVEGVEPAEVLPEPPPVRQVDVDELAGGLERTTELIAASGILR